MTSENVKIGIMGGTFDPIHIGHLATAEAVRVEYGLQKVLFIPSANPPHKDSELVSNVMHRYMMAAMATCSNPYFVVSPLEMERTGPSYTIDTIRVLKALYGTAELYFIAGSDVIQDLPKWERTADLLQMCYFVAATRPGCLHDIENIKAYFGELGQAKLHRLNTPELEISSTEIRRRVRMGESIKYIVPENVENYIYKEGLYRSASQ